MSSKAKEQRTNFIQEENYYLLHWLYRIRRVSCARGIRAGFIRPDFLWSIYRPMMRSKMLVRRTNEDIHDMVHEWCGISSGSDPQYDLLAFEEECGHISPWDVSGVTDMKQLFCDKG